MKIRYFEHDKVFPIIAKAIEDHSAKSPDYMRHKAIVDTLMADPEGFKLIDWASKRTKYENDRNAQNWTHEMWAHVMVACFSRQYTTKELRWLWLTRFEREKETNGDWSYRVKDSITGTQEVVVQRI